MAASIGAAVFIPRLRGGAGRGYTAAMNIMRQSLLTIAAALALAGCGNKGPLVLPDAPEKEAPVVVDETDSAANPAAADPATDDAAVDDTDPAAEPADDTDAPLDPEPLPQDDGDGG